MRATPCPKGARSRSPPPTPTCRRTTRAPWGGSRWERSGGRPGRLGGARDGNVGDADGVRRRLRHRRGRSATRVRAVLYDQGAGEGDRAGTGDGLRDREAERRLDLPGGDARAGRLLQVVLAADGVSYFFSL